MTNGSLVLLKILTRGFIRSLHVPGAGFKVFCRLWLGGILSLSRSPLRWRLYSLRRVQFFKTLRARAVSPVGEELIWAALRKAVLKPSRPLSRECIFPGVASKKCCDKFRRHQTYEPVTCFNAPNFRPLAASVRFLPPYSFPTTAAQCFGLPSVTNRV